MNKKSLSTEETFTLAFQNHQKKFFKVAEELYNKILKIDPNHIATHNNLGLIYQELGQYEKAINCYEKVIKIQPDLPAPYNNLGNILKELGEFKKALSYYKKAIEIKSNIADIHNNLGIVFKELKEFKKAKNCFQKAIQINPNYTIAHYNLGKIYRELGKHFEAIKSYQKTNSTRSRAELLECTYFLNGMKTYPKMLEKLVKQDPLNLRVATMAAYVAEKQNIKNTYPFCKNPFNFIFIKNLKKEFTTLVKFSKNLSEILGKTKLIWEPSSKTTTRGYHTSGNLFEKTDAEISILRKIIEKQIIIYKEKYKFQKDYFITKWPLISKIEAWHVKLIKQGYQKSHIHPAGWLSGVFYLKVPKLLSKNEGSIEFTLSGYDYPPDKNLPNLIHTPKAFDIALFPSSLFHNTIPFSSQEERHVIAFDLIPK